MDTPFKFILVKPRNPDNIGACSRAMADFGLSELSLVCPFESDWEEVMYRWKQEASVAAIWGKRYQETFLLNNLSGN